MHVVHLEDRRGRTKAFPLGPGFLVDGAPVTLTPPQAAAATALADARRAASRTASGSVAVEGARARVASGSRIYVEGRHDAELVEKVWGDDLRVEGVVVELMDGVDDLAGIIAEFEPAPGVGSVSSSTISCRARRRRASSSRHGRCPASPGTSRSSATPTSTCGSPCAPSALAGSSGRSSRGHVVEARHLRRARVGAREPGRHRPSVEAHPGDGALLRGPRADPARQRRGAHRLRD